MARFLTIGERIHVISPTIRKALQERNPEPILARAREQIEAGATGEIIEIEQPAQQRKINISLA